MERKVGHFEYMTTREIFWTSVFQTIVMSLLCCHSCCACDQDEYEINGKCCRKCSPGGYVARHCTKLRTGSCVPCMDSTFSEKPNALNKCHPCAVCAEDRGLKTVMKCTPSSDTVCGVLEEHYCIDRYGEGCREAKGHTTCKPGQSVKQPGTEYNDTVCEPCSDHSYSNGSFTSCKPYTDCVSRGLVTIKSGNHSSDSECGERSRGPVIASGVFLTTIIFYMLYKKKCKPNRFLQCPASDGSGGPRSVRVGELSSESKKVNGVEGSGEVNGILEHVHHPLPSGPGRQTAGDPDVMVEGFEFFQDLPLEVLQDV